MWSRSVGAMVGCSLVLGASFSWTTAAHAGECDLTEPTLPPRSSAEVAQRLEQIEQLLEVEARTTQRWRWAWVSVYGGLGVGQTVARELTDDLGRRADLAIGAVTSGVGFTARLLIPFPPASAARRLREELGDVEHRLLVAERLLCRAARAEKRGRGILPRLGALTLAGTSAAVAWFGYDRKRHAVSTLIGGVAIVEASVWTQPTRALQAWRARPTASHGHWIVAVTPGFVGVVGSF